MHQRDPNDAVLQPHTQGVDAPGGVEIVGVDADFPVMKDLGNLSKDDGAGFEFVSPQVDERKYFGVGVGIGLRKGNDALKVRLNGALKTLTENGSLETYALKYFPFAIHGEKWVPVQ